ncbi:MAG: arginyltransferase, partial [Proteobacteria bacterium]|nr:arginyltransferase [Pseudomonadota bacterium]
MKPQETCFFPGLPVPLGLEVATTPPHECPYLPGRAAVSRGFRCDAVPGWAYQALMDAGFRRSGHIFYQMVCAGCRACVPIRVPVGPFQLSRSQRRVWRRNRDLKLTLGPPQLTAEKAELYARYLAARHDRQMSGEYGELEEFLYGSPTETQEMCYREPDGRLVGVGICDRTPEALSTVYFFFDPDHGRRGLGIFSSLVEIRVARSLGLSYYYLGYWVPGCPKMEYKSGFQPCQLLATDAVWR